MSEPMVSKDVETLLLSVHGGAAQETVEAAHRIVQALAAAEANLATFGMVELAVRNPNVSSYIAEWEGRALRAEAKLAELDAERAAHACTQQTATEYTHEITELSAELTALKARLARAEAVCEAGSIEYMCDEPDCGSAACRALAAWRAAK